MNSPGDAAGVDAAVGRVTITLRAVPAHARLYLDGQLLGSNPYETRVLPDLKPRRLRVEALGYETKIETISFERDVMVEVVLARMEGGVAEPTRRAAPTVAPVNSRGVEPATLPPTRKKKPSRHVDENNPWAD
jgi:hypothetical protein